MKFLIDNAISPLISNDLKSARHDAVHVRDYGLQSAADSVILARAAKESRILVSADVDFGTLLAQAGSRRPSVILFRRSTGKPNVESKMLSELLARETVRQELETGCIVVVEPHRIRIRTLPIQLEND